MRRATRWSALDRDDLDVTNPARVERLIVRERPRGRHQLRRLDRRWTPPRRARPRPSWSTARARASSPTPPPRPARRSLYPSTDYVFDGTKKGPYTESDEPNPLQAYGRTKLAGERATAHVNRNSFIVRTSWLFGPGEARTSSRRCCAWAREAGRWSSSTTRSAAPPTPATSPSACVRLIDSAAYGIHHMAGEGSCSWYEFAMEIFRQAEVVTRVMASTSDMMERPAKRPANSVLGSGREAPIELPDWQRGLADYLARRERPEPEEHQSPRAAGSTVRRQPVLELHREERRGGVTKRTPKARTTQPAGARPTRPSGEEPAA